MKAKITVLEAESRPWAMDTRTGTTYRVACLIGSVYVRVNTTPELYEVLAKNDFGAGEFVLGEGTFVPETPDGTGKGPTKIVLKLINLA